MTTQSLLASAYSYNITSNDFDNMTIGLLCDILSEYIPEDRRIKAASQHDIDIL